MCFWNSTPLWGTLKISNLRTTAQPDLYYYVHRVLPEEQPLTPEIQSVLFLFFIKNYLSPCHNIDEKQGNTWLSQKVAIICYHEVWLHIRKSSCSHRWVSFLTLLRVKQSNCFGSSMKSPGLSLLLSPQACVFHPQGHMVLAGELWSEQEEEGRRKGEVPWFSRKVEVGTTWRKERWITKSDPGMPDFGSQKMVDTRANPERALVLSCTLRDS